MRLRKIRRERDITQKDLALKLSMTQAAVSSWEKKGVEPPFDTVCKIAKILNCDPNYLLGFGDDIL